VKTASHQMPSRFRFTCLVPENDVRFERLGLMIQRQLSEIGIDMQLQPVNGDVEVKRIRSGEYEAFLLEPISGNLEWAYMFWHSTEPGVPSLFSLDYHGADAALDRLRGARTDEQTRTAVRDVQRAMYEDPPAVFLCYGQRARVINGRFQLPPVSDRDTLLSLSQWRPSDGAAPLPASP